MLETPRMVIREMCPDDIDAIYKIYEGPSITKYMENLFTDKEEERQYMKDYYEHVYCFYGYGMWVITLKESEEVIGRAGLEYKEGFDGLEIGFMLGKEHQHKGYAYEACKAILEYAKAELEQNEIHAVVHKENHASIALCERLGLHKNSHAKVKEGFCVFSNR